jgi:hypothetical protein
MPAKCNPTQRDLTLVPLRFEIREAAQILRMSRAQLYNRINDGAIKPHKDGARTYITRVELERYVDGRPSWGADKRDGASSSQNPTKLTGAVALQVFEHP